jgi:ketosteroid isomerase-like protein
MRATRTSNMTMVVAMMMLFAAFAVRSVAAAPPNEKLTEAQANDLQDKFDHAMGANDAATVASLLADNVVFVHPSAAVQTKAELVAPIAAGKAHLASVDALGPRKVTLFDGGALVDGPASVNIQVPGKDGAAPTVRSNHVYVSTLWVHTAAGWQILLSHGTYLPPPAAAPAQ